MEVIEKINKTFLSSTEITTDNWIFRLHYKSSILILIFFGLLATSTQYFGTKIECTSTNKNLKQDFINQYCFIHPTYVIATTDQINLTKIEQNSMPHFGVINSKFNANDKQYNNYYQWVSIVLFIQAIFLFIPRLLWREYEKPIIENLYLNTKIDKFDELKRGLVREHIVNYLLNKRKIFNNSIYISHILIEILNLLNILSQFAFMNYFLNMNFRDYGWKVLSFNNWSYEYYFDPMSKAFPKITKCRFVDYGSSGGLNINDHLCILPLNVIHEKIYLFLWFWFQILIVFNIFNLIHRFLLHFSAKLRYKLIATHVQFVDKKALSLIVNEFSMGEWYMLNILCLNLDVKMFNEIVISIHENIIQHIKDYQKEVSV